MGTTASGIVGALVFLGVICGLYAMAKFLRTRTGLGAGLTAPDALKVVGKRSLDQKNSLYVIEVGDRYVLVGTGESGVAKIDDITSDEFAAMQSKQARESASPRTLPLRGGALLAPGQLLARKLGVGAPRVAKPVAVPSTTEATTSVTTAGPGSGKDGFMTVGESFAALVGKARGSKVVTRTNDGDGETVELDEAAS